MLKRTILSLFFLFSFFIGISQEVVVDFGYPEKVSGFQDLTPIFTHNGELLFSATDFDHKGYWITDGSEQGTRKITFDYDEDVAIEYTSIFDFDGLTSAFDRRSNRLFFLKGDTFKPYRDSTFFVNSVFQSAGHTFVVSYEHKKPPIDNRGLRLGNLYKIIGDDSLSLISSDLVKYDTRLSNFIVNKDGILFREASGEYFFHNGEKNLHLDYSENLREMPTELKVYSGFLYLLGRLQTSSEEILKFDLENGKYKRTIVSPIEDSRKTAFITSNLSLFAAAKQQNGISFIDMHDESALFSISDNVIRHITAEYSLQRSKVISFQHIEDTRLYFVITGLTVPNSYHDKLQIGFYDFELNEFKVSQEFQGQIPFLAHNPRKTMKMQVKGDMISFSGSEVVYNIDKDLNGVISQESKNNSFDFPIQLTKNNFKNEKEWNEFSTKLSSNQEFMIYTGWLEFFRSVIGNSDVYGFNNRTYGGYGIYNYDLKSFVQKNSNGRILSWNHLIFDESLFYSVETYDSVFNRTVKGYFRDFSDSITADATEIYKEPIYGQNDNEFWLSFKNDLGERQTTFLSRKKENRPVLNNVDVYQTKSRTFVHHKDESLNKKDSFSEIIGSEISVIKENVKQIITSDLNACFLSEVDSASNAIDCLIGGGELKNIALGNIGSPRLISNRFLEYGDRNTNGYNVVDLIENRNLLENGNRPYRGFSFSENDYLLFWDKVVRIRNSQIIEVLKTQEGRFSGNMKLIGNSLILVLHDEYSSKWLDAKDILSFDLVKEELKVISDGRRISNLQETPSKYFYISYDDGTEVYFWNDVKQTLESTKLDFVSNTKADKTVLSFKSGFSLPIENELLVWGKNGFDSSPIEFTGYPMFAENDGYRTTVFAYTFDKDNLIILNQILSDGSMKLVSKVPKEDRMEYSKIFFDKGEAFAYIFTKEAGWQVWKLGDYEIEPLPASLVILSTEEADEDIQVSVFPNPTLNSVRVETKDKSEVSVFNSKGQMLDNYKSSEKHQIDFSIFNPGTYLLHIRSKGKITTKKVVKL